MEVTYAAMLKMEGITKSFPGTLALNNVNLNVREGEVMALLGENGAGKSTLMKVLTGIYERDSGTVILDGREVAYTNPKQAQEDGIVFIHQELNLIPHMKVYENVFLGREVKKKNGLLDREYMIKRTMELLETVKMNLNPQQDIRTLSVAQQQMVEITKALSMDTKVIVMDEPTGALPDEEVGSLFEIIRELKKQNKCIVYISHRLKEVFEICDRATILRDGCLIAEKDVSELTQDTLISMMVGRTLDEQFPHVDVTPGETILSVKNLGNAYVRDVSFELRKGEILGVTGLVGAGRTELAKTLSGVFPWTSGTVAIKGRNVSLRSTKQAINNGIYYMTEDRKGNGLVMQLDVRANATLSSLEKISSPWTGVNGKKERRTVGEYIERLNIRTPTMFQIIKNLSGGNQQKVILAKALMTEPEVLILDEPTRGIDVGAKKEIYTLINRLKERGKAIIMISSEMPEILGMCDRILVMNEGRLKGELSRHEASQEKIMEKIIN